ncbi:MAG: hypothetical protein HY885_18300 [Deltaproteobacteria bacterium]|nr:hypothetical protein [Deltaproteobacteria bacterium]
MKKLRTIRAFSLALALTGGLFPAVSCFAFPSGSGIPSCNDDVAAKHKEPGAGPECTPTIMAQDMALEFLKTFTVRKINKKWYMVVSKEEFGELDPAARWQRISLMTSAVQSNFSEKADCLIVRVPESAEEKEALLKGDYPQKLTAAEARYVDLSETEIKTKQWPEYHHHVLFKMTVY